MFSVALCLALLLLCSMGLGILFNRRTEEWIPFLMMGIVTCLYPFYCLNLLPVGKYILYAAAAVLLVFAVRKAQSLIRQGLSPRTLVFQKMLTPGVAVFLFLAVIFLIFASMQKPAVWDELRLWAAMPKALHFSESLQVGDQALLYSTMQSYPPGISLLVYFFTSFSGAWHYGSVYAVYWIFYAALFLPAFSKMDWTKWIYLPLSVFLIVGAAIFLTLNGREASGDYAFFFGSLYIDPYIGCVLGCGLFRAVKKPFENTFSLLGFCFTLFVLSSLKNVGALYAGILFAAALIIWLTGKESGKRKRIWLAVFPLLSTVIPYASWQWIIHAKGTGEFIDFNLTGFTAEKAGNVLKGLATWGVVPFLYFALFFLLAAIVMTKVFKDIPRKDAVIAMSALGLSLLIFLYGYTSHYGLMLSSIFRYTSTFTFAAFVYLFSRCITKMNRPVGEGSARTLLVSVLFLVVAVFLLGYNRKQYLVNDTFSDAGQLYETAVSSADPAYSAKHPAKTYLALGGDTRKQSQMHETCALEALGSPVNIKSIWCDKLYNEAEDGVVTDRDEMTRIWAETLRSEDYVYVALVHPDADIRYAVSEIAPGLSLTDDPCLLKILPSDNPYGITLFFS